MALTYTPPANIGDSMPAFSVKAVSGNTIDSKDLLNKNGVLVMFICNHCPYVKAIEDRLLELGNKFKDQISIVGVCSNDASDYEEDSFENIKKSWEEKNYPFEYLYDDSQKMAKDFGAVCTPDIFLFKTDGDDTSLFYRGRLDDSWKDSSQVKTKDLENAIESLINNQSAPADQKPSMGCSIKWI